MGAAGRSASTCVFNLLLLCSSAAIASSDEIPIFITIPPPLVEFSNSSGATVQCKTNNSDAKIQWLLKDGNPVTDVKDLRKLDGGNLRFPPFKAENFRQDVHSTVYKCAATDTLGTIVSYDIKVKAVVLQPYDIYVYDVYAVQGNTAVFRCHIPSFLTSFVNVTAWIRDSVIVIKSTEMDKNSKYSLMPSGELFVKDVDTTDAMTNFQCQTYNRLNAETKKSSTSGKLFVTESQGNIPPKIIFSSNDVTVKHGQSAFLPCEVQANPPAKISWTKVGTKEPIKTSFNLNKMQISGSLIIKNVATSDSGLYRCTAENSGGQEFFDTELIVKEQLSVSMLYDKLVVDVGKPTAFSCKPSGFPLQSLRWYKNGKEITFNKDIVLNNNNNTIEISSVSDKDKGIYQCCIKNDNDFSCGYTALVLGDIPPVIIEKFNASINNKGDSIKIRCVAKGNPIPTIMWFLDENKLSSTNKLVIQTNINQKGNIVSTLNINNLQTLDGGLYKCVAENRAGNDYHWSRINVYGPVGFRPQPPLNVVNGKTAILNCPLYGYPIGYIEWEKDGTLLPNELHQTQAMNDSLIIQNVVRNADSGVYSCTIKNSDGSEVVGNVQVNIQVAPKLSPFSFQDELVQEGSRGRVQCVVVEGDSPINIEWRKDDKLIPTDLVSIRNIDEFSSILLITAITPRHNGKYTCIARNAAGTASFSTNLAVNVAPKITPFSFPESGLTEGVLARVSCVVYQGDLPIEISWLRNGIVLLDDSIVTKPIDDYSSILTIENVKRQHAGNYTCLARNSASSVSLTTKLLVNVPPKWSLEPVSQTVKNGIDVYFNCKAEGYPLPSIKWRFSKDIRSATKPLLHISGKTELLNNGTLILRTVSKENEGRYICQASNGIGRSPSTTVILSVLAPPTLENKNEILNGKLGENLSLTCAAKGDAPIKIIWFYNEAVIKSSMDSRFVIIFNENTSTSTLTINKLTRGDSTKLTCKGENSFGEDTKDFHLTVQEPPDAPVLDSNAIVGNRSIFLSWGKPYDGKSKISHYIIQYKKQIDNWQLRKFNQTVEGSKTSVNVINLLPAVGYTFRVAAVNDVGTSKFSNEISKATDADAPTGTVQNIEIEPIDGNTLRISWKSPRKDTWNGAIRGYNIGYRVDGSNEPYEFSALEVPEDYTEDLIYQLSNLKKYTTYAVVIQAYNEKGAGPLSESILVMTSEDVPSSAPEGLRCSALSSRSIYVLWDSLPLDNVNGILRGYKVFYKPVTEWYDSQTQFKISEKPKVTLQNLDVNTNYSISVLAYTKVGDGIKTIPVHCKTHEDVPDRPSEIKVLSSSSDSVIVTWKRPRRVNGDLIKYNIYYRPLSESEEIGANELLKTQQSKTNNVHTFQSDMEYIEVKGLKKNQKYAFWVSATSAIGEGQHSDVIAQSVADTTVAATSASFDEVIQTPWKRDIALPCRAVGIPPPQRKWLIGNAVVPIGGRNILLSDGTLLINKVENEDSGNYTCTIYNSHGRDHVQYSLIVQVPPSSPIMDIISKSRSSIQIQWKQGPNGGDTVKGYTLHYRKDGGEWETVELGADKEIFTLNNLACGAHYQIFLEAFNKVGKGVPGKTLTVSTEGSEITIPTKDQLLHEGSTFVSVHLETWPITSCPIQSFQVEYKSLTSDEWTTVSSSIRPTQRKLVVPGLNPATWYDLRVTAITNGGAVPAEYKFATRTVTGGTIPPPEIRIEKPQAPIYIFYLDPYIFIPAVALLIVVIIASAVLCVWMKRKNGSVGTPSDDYGSVGRWNGSGKASSSYTGSTLYATIPHHKRKGDPNPYASGRVGDYYPDSDAWIETRTLTRGTPSHPTQGIRVMPQRMSEAMQMNRQGIEETTFAFGNDFHSNPDYDRPPKGM